MVKFMLHPINLSLSMLISLSKILGFYNILAKIFDDLPFSCQSLQGSLTFLSRSLRIFKSLAKIFNLLVKIFKDLSFSCQDLQRPFISLPRFLRVFYFFSRSSIFLPRSLRIYKIFNKISKDWWKDRSRFWQESKSSLKISGIKWEILKGIQKNLEDPQRIFNIFKGSSKFLSRFLKKLTRSSRILTRTLKILKDLGKKIKDPWRSWQEFWRSLIWAKITLLKTLVARYIYDLPIRKSFTDLKDLEEYAMNNWFRV